MDPDQEICLCFHVSRRKIESFLRIEKPVRAAQLAECYGAGTGCGWCRKYLTALFDAHARAGDSAAPTVGDELSIPTADQYAAMRRVYRQRGGRGSSRLAQGADGDAGCPPEQPRQAGPDAGPT